MLADSVKQALTVGGRAASPRTLRRLDFLVSYLYTGQWMATHGLWPGRRFKDRPALFQSLFGAIGDRPVLYLEFGVYEGYSMQLWSKGLTHPDSRLVGFDSFEGLPEHWHSDAPIGRFDLGGVVPRFKDDRVSLVKGWFEDTLKDFALPKHTLLVVNLDADIYSSTKFVLEWLRPHLRVGDMLYFDEFFDRTGELRAFDEFLSVNPMQLSLLGATRTLNEVAFRIDAMGARASVPASGSPAARPYSPTSEGVAAIQPA